MWTRMLLGALLCGLLSEGALCQTWDGEGGTNNWTEGLNWSNNNAPANNGTATPNFAGGGRPTPVVNVDYNVNGITFDNQSIAFNIFSSGVAELTIRSGGVTNNNSGVTQTITALTNLGAAQTWGGVGSLIHNGTVKLNSNVLTVDTPLGMAFNGIVSGSGSIVKIGDGVVILSGNNTFSGGVTLNSGKLAIGSGSGLGTGALTINGGNLEGTGANRVVPNSVLINNDFAIPSGTGVTFSGPLTLTGTHTLTNSITNLAISGAIGQNSPGAELALAGGGTLALSGSALTLGTSIRHDSGTLTATGLVTTPGNTLTQNGGTFTGTLINRGSFVFNGGAHSGNIANDVSGMAIFNANFTFTAAVNNQGTLRVANSRTLTFGAQQLNNTGTIELVGGALSASGSSSFASSGTLKGYGTIDATNTSIINTGQVNVTGGNLTLASNFNLTNSGTVTIAQGHRLFWNSTAGFNNLGLTQLSGGILAGTGQFWNGPSGEIRGGGTIQSRLANLGGVIRATGETPLTIVNLADGNVSGGELRVDEGATMTVQSAFSSSGTMVLAGPNASLKLNSVTNSGTLRGQGRVTGAVLNNGVIRAESGVLTFASNGNTNTAAGRLEASVGAQLVYSQGLAANAGLVALTGGSLDNNNLALSNSGRIEGYGSVRTGGLSNSGTIAIGGTLDVIGPVTNTGTVNTSAGSTARFFGPVTGAGGFTGTGTVTFLDTFAPGASPAAVSFGGNVELGGGSGLVIEIGGSSPGSQFDTVTSAGTISLGGSLDVDLLGGFTPAPGSTFRIMNAAGGIDGAFSSATFPSVSGANWKLIYQPDAVLLQVVLSGDYNLDGSVDAADYSLWRDTLGQTGSGLPADGNGNHQVDEADYDVWKASFGASVGGNGNGGLQNAGSVPEPSSVVLLVAMFCSGSMFSRGSRTTA